MSRKNKSNKAPLLLPLGALAAGFGLSTAALAQTAAPAQKAPAKEESVLPTVRAKASAEPQGKDGYQATETRIGKGKQDIRDIPQSLTVVTEKLIDDRNLDNVKEVLKNTAGITFQAAEGGEEDIKIHGISLQSTGDIFIDGMRDPAFYDRDTFFLDKIELLRGSGALMFGRGSSGGAVNQVTKQAVLADQNQIDVTVASHGGLRAVGDFNTRSGETTAWRIGAMVNRADNDGSGNMINKSGIAGSLRTGIGETDEFGLTLYALQNGNGMNYGMPWVRPTPTAPVSSTTLIPVEPTAYYGMASDRNKGSANYVMGTHTHRFSPDVELVTKARYASYTRDQRAGTVRFAAAALQPGGIAASLATFGPNTVLTRGTQLKIQDLQTLTVQSDLSAKLKAAGMEHHVMTGVDFAQEKKQVYNDTPGLTAQQRASFYAALGLTKPNTLVGRPDDGASIDESRRQPLKASEYTSRSAGAYVQDMVSITPEWKLVAGLRYDKLKGDYDNFNYSYNATGTPGYDKISRTTTDSYQMNVSEWSKRAAVLFQPSAQLSLHLMAATSFNTSGDTYSLSAANANIPPEKSVNLEFGGQYDSADGKLTTRFGIFRATKLHERNTDPLTQLVELSGKRHAQGIDIDITGRITADWEVFGTFTWMPTAIIDIGAEGAEGQGARPSLTPRYSGSLWTTYKITPQWRVGGGLNARSGQQPNRNPGFYAPKFVIANLMAEYAVVEDTLLFRLNVDNVTNKLYADTLYTGHYVPGKGRIVALTGTYKF
ncbi:catecholate siderophore receptor [Pelomonas saccharophila]|uniref:Catecholate siderophore receptor n=1 Tax=Roseateles saccharophilus TaxID=304 RepID=A0ABU1YRJ6_ROSSA|nr:TonB-dependent receptor [Roseateles saccharophilus]MDR7270581.1 catecholate siderophore receptor [Roseateles saccharophilus]